ncbi:hypothetical protein [Hirschia litorea]|uniref:Uncharacterized protein n=1 Tax=Hirschia litorea TaxID=1199156 RepID=A0ABW2IIN0_9PROT
MRYFVDCEFNSFGGDVLSIAIAPEHGKPLYLARPKNEIAALVREDKIDPWVVDYVLPVISANGLSPTYVDRSQWGLELQRFLRGDTDIVFVADWPEDIAHLMQVMMIAPGGMINLPCFKVEMRRVDAYFTNLEGAVRHNALWDALSLRNLYLMENGELPAPMAKRA